METHIFIPLPSFQKSQGANFRFLYEIHINEEDIRILSGYNLRKHLSSCKVVWKTYLFYGLPKKFQTEIPVIRFRSYRFRKRAI